MLIDVSKMTSSNRFDLVTVGHFAIDTISSPKLMQSRTTLGGPVTYVSTAAARLGARVSVISMVGKDFPNEFLDWFQNSHVNLSGLKRTRRGVTTRFSLRYQYNDRRRHQLKAVAPSIQASDIPKLLQTQAIHVAPIANELSTDVIQVLRKRTPFLSLDPQGFVRRFDSNGNVQSKRWRGKAVLELVDIYKSTQNEMKTVTGKTDAFQAARRIQDYGVKVVVATRGLHGSTLLVENRFYSVPAYRPRMILDPTGAGDTYIGAFLAEYIRGKDPQWCACVGSAAASFVVEGIGPERFGNREETYARARIIYQKCR